MGQRALDPVRSHVRVHTFAEGLFARLAHDLELRCAKLRGVEDGRRAEVVASIGDIEVVGVLDRARTVADPHALSPSDRDDILRKMAGEVFQVARGAGEVRVDATIDERGSASVRLTLPNGRVTAATTLPAVHDAGGELRVQGTFELSLAAVGSAPIKGPMGAFRVKDRVTVHYDVTFA